MLAMIISHVSTAAGEAVLGFPLVVERGSDAVIGGMRAEPVHSLPGHEPSEEWLRAVDARCRAADIRPERRAWFAVRDYAAHRRMALRQTDPVAERIFAWFRENAG